MIPARSGVKRDLLAGRGERPCDLQAPLLAEVEAHLAGGTQAFRTIRAEGRTWPCLCDRAQHVLVKEAALTRDLRPIPSTCHPISTCLCLSSTPTLAAGLLQRRRGGHQSAFADVPQSRFPETRNTFVTSRSKGRGGQVVVNAGPPECPGKSGVFVYTRGPTRIFRSFRD